MRLVPQLSVRDHAHGLFPCSLNVVVSQQEKPPVGGGNNFLWKLGSQTAGILKAFNQGSVLSASPWNPGCLVSYLQSPARLPFQGLEVGFSSLPLSLSLF